MCDVNFICQQKHTGAQVGSFWQSDSVEFRKGKDTGSKSRWVCRYAKQGGLPATALLSGHSVSSTCLIRKSAAAAWRPWVTRIPHNQVLLNLLQAAGTFCLCPSGNLQDFTAENLLSSTFCLAGEKTRTPHVTSNICLSGSTVQVLKVNLRTATVKTDISQGDGQQLSHRASP